PRSILGTREENNGDHVQDSIKTIGEADNTGSPDLNRWGESLPRLDWACMHGGAEDGWDGIPRWVTGILHTPSGEVLRGWAS
ncbi:MAG: hypothetical protein QXE79_08730, partial [Candidatus Bathyarchaeia archaeon]